MVFDEMLKWTNYVTVQRGYPLIKLNMWDAPNAWIKPKEATGIELKALYVDAGWFVLVSIEHRNKNHSEMVE